MPLCLLFAAGSVPARAQDKQNAWSGLWNECYDVHTIGFDERMGEFTKLVRTGKSWQKDVDAEKRAIDAVTDKTCKSWAASPNGDGFLKEFRRKYGKAAGMALSLEDEAENYLLASLQKWNKLQQEEVRTLVSHPSGKRDLQWDVHFPCSRAFTFAMKHVQNEVRAIQEKFNRLREQCPAAANDAIQAAEQKTSAAFAQNNLKGKAPGSHRKPSGRASDITGTEKKSP
ncbi:MAG TPA: hypothetical protein VIH99_10735 [Bdellovibrionota bacterium]